MDNNRIMNRTLYFYSFKTKAFDLTKDPHINYNNKYFLENSFKEGKRYAAGDSKVIEIITFNDHLLFGSIGKLEKITDSVLKRQRQSTTLEPLEDTSILNNILFEDFTYFLISNNFNDIVVLRNSEAPQINKALPIPMKKKCAELENAWVLPKTIDSLSNELNKYTDIFKIDIAMDHEKSKNFKPTVKELKLLSDDAIDKASLTLTLKKSIANKDFIEELSHGDFKGYANFKIHATNTETDTNETIDLVTKILTKKISIPLTDSILKDSKSIRDILYKELFANIKRYS